jgi:hypothetical protein
MNLARVHGPTRLSKNLKSSNASMIFKILLKGYLIGRSNLFKQIRGGGGVSKTQRIGVSHHVSCPHAHQQNGSAERKHCHIVDVGLSLLAQASMPFGMRHSVLLSTS